jgi:uncharacterized damage-inducible protein DinB
VSRVGEVIPDDGLMATFPEPTELANSRSETLLRYLEFFRGRVLELVGSLQPGTSRRSPLPSAWTPIELVRHLTYVELRWLQWGFAGRAVPAPWGDEQDGRWYVSPDEPDAAVFDALRTQGERSREIVAAADLEQPGVPGPRWDGAEPATLERVLLHLIQEYARHLGQLDVVVELANGSAGGE